MCNIMSKRHNILPIYFFSREKLRGGNSKWNFSSCSFIADHSHAKIVWLHVVVFNEHNILHFWDNVRLWKCYPVKVPQNCFISFYCSN